MRHQKPRASASDAASIRRDIAARIAARAATASVRRAVRAELWPDEWHALGALGTRDQAPPPVVAVLVGTFRPPHAGHVTAVLRLLQCCDVVVIVVEPDDDDGGGRTGRGPIDLSLSMRAWFTQLFWAGVQANEPRSGVVLMGFDGPEAERVVAGLGDHGQGPCVAVRVVGQEARVVTPDDSKGRLPLLLLPRESGGVSSTDVRSLPIGLDDAALEECLVARVLTQLFPGGPESDRIDVASAIARALVGRAKA